MIISFILNIKRFKTVYNSFSPCKVDELTPIIKDMVLYCSCNVLSVPYLSICLYGVKTCFIIVYHSKVISSSEHTVLVPHKHVTSYKYNRKFLISHIKGIIFSFPVFKIILQLSIPFWWTIISNKYMIF